MATRTTRSAGAGVRVNLPNLITLARILSVPVLVWAIAGHQMLMEALTARGQVAEALPLP